MTKAPLLRLAKVRRTLIVPIVVFSSLTALADIRLFGAGWPWLMPLYALFDSLSWIGVAFLIFAVIERRQTMPPQPRLRAMAAATVCIAALAMTMITLRAFFSSLLMPRPFAWVWFWYLPGQFFNATFYIAIVTGIGYAVHSWAVDDRRLAEAAELDAAIARAELKAAAGRLQPEFLDAHLARISALMESDPTAAQHLISHLGALLHDSFARASSERATTLP